MRNLQIRKGLKINIPRFELAELGYSTDTKELHIGNGDGTYATFIDETQTDTKIEAIKAQLNLKKVALQRELDNKAQLDNQPVDLNFIQASESTNTITQVQVTTAPNNKQDYAFSSYSDLVTMQNGLTYEKVYTGLLKNSAKTFTSTGEPIMINNGIPKQKLLGLKISGQAAQVVLVNNGVSYPFYKSLSDKTNNKILALDTGDVLEILLDGTGKLTQSGVVTIIPKEIIPVIVTYETNCISLDSMNGPSALEVTLSVNKIEENQARINTLKAQVAQLAALLTN